MQRWFMWPLKEQTEIFSILSTIIICLEHILFHMLWRNECITSKVKYWDINITYHTVPDYLLVKHKPFCIFWARVLLMHIAATWRITVKPLQWTFMKLICPQIFQAFRYEFDWYYTSDITSLARHIFILFTQEFWKNWGSHSLPDLTDYLVERQITHCIVALAYWSNIQN